MGNEIFNAMCKTAEAQGAFVDKCLRDAKESGAIPKDFIPRGAYGFSCPLPGHVGFPCMPLTCWKKDAPCNGGLNG
jgi:hypothetical protein